MRKCSHSFTLGDRQSVWETKREASVWWLETIRVNGKRRVRNSLTKRERGGRRHTKLGGDDKRAHLLHWHLSLRFIVSPSKIKRAEGRSFFCLYSEWQRENRVVYIPIQVNRQASRSRKSSKIEVSASSTKVRFYMHRATGNVRWQP